MFIYILGMILGVAIGLGISGLIMWVIGSFIIWAFGISCVWTYWHGLVVAFIIGILRSILKK